MFYIKAEAFITYNNHFKDSKIKLCVQNISKKLYFKIIIFVKRLVHSRTQIIDIM